ncbi:carbohydrate binding family 9 domain-containing protein [Undibacterium flavidum]|uniref:Carbohydrate binding family 9 domain-containing protein n=1 Tax=Undibacterium flavidum TaxID=2762297 RepID=A0ABR6YAX7_9BURK|nr:carbohydrate binding family 9 domain-containing protein [Undibacterium flavidum]MBC3873792.1 carbohydrate binding family 9 domain-containing protein [Undibacterium flavidum]
MNYFTHLPTRFKKKIQQWQTQVYPHQFKKSPCSALLLSSSLVCLLASGAAQAADTLTIPRANKPPVLADYVAGLPSEHGVEINTFRQYRPGNGTPASQDSKAYLSYDDKHFYAIFVVKADPKSVRANIAKRENIIGDDEVVLELDTFNDKQRSFVFHANPYGVQFDGKRTEGIGLDFNFDTQWQSEGQLTQDGFVVSMAIPFKSLRFNASEVQNWGIAVGRIVGGINEWSFWPYITDKDASFVGQMAQIQIPAKLVPGRNLQINPSLFTGQKKLLNSSNPSAALWQQENKSRPGLDAKWVVSEAMALDLTLNPDFSEVESDEPQALVNKRYEVLFPEKRPFFLENASMFQTPQNLFFSRRIIEPKAGARLTGREGNWSFGGLVIDDAAVGKFLPVQHASYGDKANIVVARVQNDFSNGSNLGAMLTERRLGNISNSVVSADMRYQLDKNWNINAQFAHSQTKDGATTKLQDDLGFLEVKHTGRNFLWTSQYLDIGENFDRKLAYLPRNDIRQFTQQIRYIWDFTEPKIFNQAGPQLKAIVSRDHQNLVQDWSLETDLILRTKFATDITVVNVNSYELYEGRGFQKYGNGIGVVSELLDWLSINFVTGTDKLINYVPAAGQDPSLNQARDFSLTLGFKPHSQLRIDETLLYNDLHTMKAIASLPVDSAIYRDLVFRSKIAYQHNRYLGVRLVLDYHNLQANPLLSGIKSGKQLNKDLQLSYVLGPGTTIYAGYADRQENLATVSNPQRVVQTDKLDLITGRSVFVKLNYLFQL